MQSLYFAPCRPAPVGVTAGRRVRSVVARATALPTEVKKVAPLGHRVFVKVGEQETRTEGGVFLPIAAQKRSTQGEIVDAGTAKNLKKGDRIVYSKYAGTDVELQSEEFVLLKEDDVIGLVGGDDIAQLHPCQDRLLIRMEEAQTRTSGGLLLSEGAQEKPTIGTVVAAGPGRARDEEEAPSPPAVQPGAKVLYSKYSGTEFDGRDGRKYIVIREADILAVLS